MPSLQPLQRDGPLIHHVLNSKRNFFSRHAGDDVAYFDLGPHAYPHPDPYNAHRDPHEDLGRDGHYILYLVEFKNTGRNDHWGFLFRKHREAGSTAKDLSELHNLVPDKDHEPNLKYQIIMLADCTKVHNYVPGTLPICVIPGSLMPHIRKLIAEEAHPSKHYVGRTHVPGKRIQGCQYFLTVCLERFEDKDRHDPEMKKIGWYPAPHGYELWSQYWKDKMGHEVWPAKND